MMRSSTETSAISSKRAHMLMPALLTSVSTRPNASTAPATTAWQSRASATSALTVTTGAPALRHSSATASSSAAPRAASTSFAPFAASCRASSAPIPFDAPVMMTTLSFISGRSNACGNAIGSRHSRVGGNPVAFRRPRAGGNPRFATRGLRANVRVQIVPFAVVLLDQPHFPSAVPFLQPLLAGDRRFGIVVHFIPHQGLDAVFLGETVDHAFTVLPDPLWKIRSHADIQCSMRAGGEDIYGKVLFHFSSSIDVWLFNGTPGFPPTRE